MSVLDQLACALGRKDEVPNQELAKRIADTNDKVAVKELVENLQNKSKDIRHDCIKTLYETGYHKPEMIAPYANVFVRMLEDKNPRMVWGAMAAISTVAPLASRELYHHLPKIIDVADHSGSVIARDHAIYTLAALAKNPACYSDCFALISEQLLKAPVNQFPMYCEITAPVIQPKHINAFLNILHQRLEGIDQESKRKRVLKVIKSVKNENLSRYKKYN